MFGKLKLLGKSGTVGNGNRVGVVFGPDAVLAFHIAIRPQAAARLLSAFTLEAPETERLAHGISEWAAQQHLKGTPTVMTLPLGSYGIFPVERPDVPEQELRSALRWRLKDLLGYPPSSAVIDYFDAPPARQKRVEPLQVVAARTDELKPRVAALREAGLDPVRIDIPEFALRNLVRIVPDNEVTTAMLSFEGNRGLLGIFREDRFYLSRTLDHGLPALDASNDAADGLQAFDPASDRIALEVQRTMDYYESHFGTGPVKQLLVLGGDARASRLASHALTPDALLEGSPLPGHDWMPLALGGILGLGRG